MEQLDEEVQKYVLARLNEARNGRSWNWLSQQIDVAQSTLSNQVTGPRFTLETVVRAARILRKPVGWFFPGDGIVAEADAAAAYYEIETIIRAARENAT